MPNENPPELTAGDVAVAYANPRQNGQPLPEAGKSVLYVMSKLDCEELARRQADMESWHKSGRQSDNSTQAPPCPAMEPGQVVPGFVSAVSTDDQYATVDIKCIFDPHHVYWARRVPFGSGQGTWHWPAVQKRRR